MPQKRRQPAKRSENKVADTSAEIAIGGRVDAYRRRKAYQAERSRALVGRPVKPGYVSQDKLLQLYRFKGFEYGNWCSQQDRAEFLAMSQQSFRDISKILGFTNLGLNETIGVAYGARGKGGRARAHFEPWSFMINLTKPHGYGAFAHEYGHALDCFFGTYIDQDSRGRFLTFENTVARRVNLNPFKAGSLRYLANDLVNQIIEAEPGKVSASYKQLQARTDNRYWFERIEIFARCFEQYIQVRLREKKIVNRYLTQRKYDSAYYLTPADFNRIRPLIDKLVAGMAAIVNKK